MPWLLEWLIAAVNVVFYLFKQRLTSITCRVLKQAYINNIVSLLSLLILLYMYMYTYKSKNLIVLSNNQL